MRNYMPKVGSLGVHTMFRACTVQVNLDFSSEADMIRKFRASLALQPMSTKAKRLPQHEKVFRIFSMKFEQIFWSGNFHVFLVHLKSYLEMRGADGGLWRGSCNLSALWVCYTRRSHSRANWTFEER
ncbi:hypothetical protein V6N13_122328 [Hibiscus sabdariffa]|uniref:Uncharacterized protein n=2 Tax=Hibiscus sabdariffa TaxID=183260 RepID=A0ABR1ZSC2_9ROSI